MTNEAIDQYDVVIIGAGVAGLYQLYRIRQLGLSVRLYEDGSGVGGTWYWNRYPGCRFDSESYTYGYSWSEELLQEWDWEEFIRILESDYLTQRVEQPHAPCAPEIQALRREVAEVKSMIETLVRAAQSDRTGTFRDGPRLSSNAR